MFKQCIKTMEVPPASDLVDFDAFASVMNNAPLDDLHKYVDSDDEQDLEENYAGEEEAEKENIKYRLFDRLHRQPSFMDVDSSFETNDSDDEHVEDDGQTYDYIDPRLDIDLSQLRPSHAASHFLDPDLQTAIDQTESVLEQLSIQAEPILDEQPFSTRIILANQAAAQVLKRYGVHGSQARLSESVMRFLAGGDTVRRPGKDGRDKKDGRLRFAVVEPDADMEDGEARRYKLKTKSEQEDETRSGDGGLQIKVPHIRADGGFGGVMNERRGVPVNNKLLQQNGAGKEFEYHHQASTSLRAEGPGPTADALSYRKASLPMSGSVASEFPAPPPSISKFNLYLDGLEDIPPKPPVISNVSTPTTSQGSKLGRLGKPDSIAFTPLAATFSDSLFIKTPTSKLVSWVSTAQNSRTCSCTFDSRANAALAKEAYNPVSLKFSWPATTRSSGQPCMPTPGLLDALNQIFHLTNAEGRFMLSYYVRKYGTAMSLSGPDSNVEPPHALFRLGIAQYLNSKVGKVIDHKESDELGLNPEARRVLGEAWERHPSTQACFEDDLLQQHDEDGMRDDEQRQQKEAVRGGLNPLEKALLARACNISVGTVDTYWEYMREKTKAWAAMKAWCRARSLENIARAKVEGRW